MNVALGDPHLGRLQIVPLNGEACPIPILGIRAGVVFIGGN